VKHWTSLLFILILLGIGQQFLLDRATSSRLSLSVPDGGSYVPDGSIMKISALEFDGLASDFLFLKAMTFMGETLDHNETPKVKFQEYLWLLRILNTITDLDPYFYDPYYFGNAQLTWNEYTSGKYLQVSQGVVYANDYLIRENSVLLDKGIHFRNLDWYLPFLNGFNQFYFLHDDLKASQYLMEAARKTNNSPLLATLAARLAYQGSRTENAILFLSQMIENTQDEAIKNSYLLRLEALKQVFFLEQGVDTFVSHFERQPISLQELIDQRIIKDIPHDPYGGAFYLDENGKIKTTSNLIPNGN